VCMFVCGCVYIFACAYVCVSLCVCVFVCVCLLQLVLKTNTLIIFAQKQYSVRSKWFTLCAQCSWETGDIGGETSK